jgi:hypothetical protein
MGITGDERIEEEMLPADDKKMPGFERKMKPF